MAILVITVLAALAVVGHGQLEDAVIEFDAGPMEEGPMSMGDVPPEVLELLGMPPGSHQAREKAVATSAKRDAQDVQSLLRAGRGGAGNGHSKLRAEDFLPPLEEVVIEEEVHGPKRRQMASRSHMPVGAFQDLFPGPLTIQGPFGLLGGELPMGGPDPMILDMLQSTSHAFREEMLPAIHAAGVRSGRLAPETCAADLRKHCLAVRSQLHCLGQHQQDISDRCRREVGQSVPFLCSEATERYCDLLQEGVLSCLASREKDLKPACRDAVDATRRVIQKASAQKTALLEHGVRREVASSKQIPAAHSKAEVGAAAASTFKGTPALATATTRAGGPRGALPPSQMAMPGMGFSLRVLALLFLAAVFGIFALAANSAASGKKGWLGSLWPMSA